MINAITKIKVSEKITPLTIDKRSTPYLVIGNDYFVSFANNIAYPCKLVEIIGDSPKILIRIEIPTKPLSKRGYLNRNGEYSHDWNSSHIIYPNEIGLTPEEAVQNCVS